MFEQNPTFPTGTVYEDAVVFFFLSTNSGGEAHELYMKTSANSKTPRATHTHYNTLYCLQSVAFGVCPYLTVARLVLCLLHVAAALHF